MLDKLYRPVILNDYMGNEAVKKEVQTFFDKGKVPHAFLITGPTGCGKTTLGRIIGRMLDAQETDITEIDTAQMNGIETVRDIRRTMQLLPRHPKSKSRVYIIDEVHMLGQGGASEKNLPQNALLKALEEPPDHVYFILCTTDPQRLLPTLKGRCTPLQVETLDKRTMQKLLVRISRAEGITLPASVRDHIAEQSEGHSRNAVKMLESVMYLETEDEMLAAVQEVADKQNAAIDLARALIAGKKWPEVSKILVGLQTESEETIRRMILSYCNSILLKKQDPKAFVILDTFIQPFYDSGKPGLTHACYSIVHGG